MKEKKQSERENRVREKKQSEREVQRMTTIRRFCCEDLLRFSSVNLDHLTETVRLFFCSQFLSEREFFHWFDAFSFSFLFCMISDLAFRNKKLFSGFAFFFSFLFCCSSICLSISHTWRDGRTSSMLLKVQEGASWDTVSKFLLVLGNSKKKGTPNDLACLFIFSECSPKVSLF